VNQKKEDNMHHCAWCLDDGGRQAAGFVGETGNCVTRAITIATELPYKQVYDDLFALTRAYADEHGDRVSDYIAFNGASPRGGVFRKVFEPYLLRSGWTWTPTMRIGSGCQMHRRPDELPSGRLVVSLSRHLVAVIDGVVHDIHDCTRGGRRCVYGYYSKPRN
jgi:hypothetical protein